MELSEYQDFVKFISSGYSLYPEYLADVSTKVAKNKRVNYKTKSKKFYLKGEDLYRFVPGNIDGAKVVTKDCVMDVLAEFHGSAFGGHSGVNKTTDAIKARYWWFGLTDDVKEYIRSCEACQKSDPLKPAQRPELHPIKVSRPFELVGVDLVGPLTTTTDGNKYIFTATDYFTKWVEAYPIPAKSAVVVARCFEKLFARHGAVNAILTDQGREFLNQVNDQLCKTWNIKHKVTAAYHPQTNGLDERTNQTLKACILQTQIFSPFNTLRKLVNEKQTDWDQCLDAALFAQRTKPQSSTKFSPFFLLYGREAVYPSQLPQDFGCSDLGQCLPGEEEISSFVEQRQQKEILTKEKVSANIEKAQERQKEDYKKRTEKGRQYTSLAVGNSVLVYNSRKASTKKQSNLQPNYEGPYVLVKLEGKQATLKNSSGLVLKKTINVDRLKLFKHTAHLEKDTDTNSATGHEMTSTTDQIVTQTTDHVSPTTDTCNDFGQTAEHYLHEISENGTLQELITFINSLQFNKATLSNMNSLLRTCPLQSFIAEVSKDNEQQMDAFTSRILPEIRHMDIDLTTKTTLTMILSCICIKAAHLQTPVMTIAETLKEKPSHLQVVTPCIRQLKKTERLHVGGETIESVDLATLDQGEWVNDKIINSFLGLLKTHHNMTSTRDHIFVLPSYTAVLWGAGVLDHWMFTKVPFAKFKYILLPINVNRNHWVLMVVNVIERTVCLYDSMHGQGAERWVDLWRQFMQIRKTKTDVTERFGVWYYVSSNSSKQKDDNSCGIFTLMNAECVMKGVPCQVIRQVHCNMFRKYVKACLLQAGTTKTETFCDMPDCKIKSGVCRWVQCCVCGGWFHTKCCGISTKSALEDNFECCICRAMYS